MKLWWVVLALTVLASCTGSQPDETIVLEETQNIVSEQDQIVETSDAVRQRMEEIALLAVKESTTYKFEKGDPDITVDSYDVSDFQGQQVHVVTLHYLSSFKGYGDQDRIAGTDSKAYIVIMDLQENVVAAYINNEWDVLQQARV